MSISWENDLSHMDLHLRRKNFNGCCQVPFQKNIVKSFCEIYKFWHFCNTKCHIDVILSKRKWPIYLNWSIIWKLWNRHFYLLFNTSCHLQLQKIIIFKEQLLILSLSKAHSPLFVHTKKFLKTCKTVTFTHFWMLSFDTTLEKSNEELL